MLTSTLEVVTRLQCQVNTFTLQCILKGFNLLRQSLITVFQVVIF